MGFNIRKQDAIKWLKAQPTESVDLIITDPPYESLEKHRSIGTTTRLTNSKSSSNTWFPIISNDLFEPILLEFFRVLKNNRHFYLFCDTETMFIVKPIAENIGFKFWKPIIWDKINIGMGYHYRNRYENILFFEKGKRKLQNLSIPDILACKRVFNGYPTEKPVALSTILINQSSYQNELVVDPFMGSGSVGVAALESGRCFSGCDIAADAIKITRRRLSQIIAKETTE